MLNICNTFKINKLSKLKIGDIFTTYNKNCKEDFYSTIYIKIPSTKQFDNNNVIRLMDGHLLYINKNTQVSVIYSDKNIFSIDLRFNIRFINSERILWNKLKIGDIFIKDKFLDNGKKIKIANNYYFDFSRGKIIKEDIDREVIKIDVIIYVNIEI